MDTRRAAALGRLIRRLKHQAPGRLGDLAPKLLQPLIAGRSQDPSREAWMQDGGGTAEQPLFSHLAGALDGEAEGVGAEVALTLGVAIGPQSSARCSRDRRFDIRARRAAP